MTKKLISYSLLAHINNNTSGLTNFSQIFLPFVKKGLSSLNERGITKGKSVLEIKEVIDELFSLDIPIPYLKTLIELIVKETNEGEFKVFNDGSFIMKNYIFSDFDDKIMEEQLKVQQLENIYEEYLKSNGSDNDKQPKLIDFIEQHKLNLLKYLSKKTLENESPIKSTLLIGFLKKIKENQTLFNTLRNLYLGTIISNYLEVDFENTKMDIELVYDSSFILGLLDLKSVESTHTCRKILEISKTFGFRNTVLPITVEEIENLLYNISNNINNAIIEREIDPESIYQACDRNNLKKTDIDNISVNLRKILEKDYGIYVLPHDQIFRNKAKFNYTKLYNKYIDIRHTKFSALHDTVCEVYVIEKRKRKVTEFANSKCWFVVNTPTPVSFREQKGFFPQIIRAEVLINILWLSNPNIQKQLDSENLSEMGLSNIITNIVSHNLPHTKTIRELEDNIKKYAPKNIEISDCISAVSKISEKGESEIEKLNSLAKKDKGKFIERIIESAREKKIEEERWNKKINEQILANQQYVKQEMLKYSAKERELIAEQKKIDNKERIFKEEKKETQDLVNELTENFDKSKTTNNINSWVIVGLSVLIVSIVLWFFEKLFSVSLQNNTKYWCLKSDIQIIIIFLALLIKNNKNWKTYLTLLAGGVFLLITIILAL